MSLSTRALVPASLVAVLALFLSANHAQASPALSFISATPGIASVTSTRGYAFDVLAPGGIMVTHLSLYDVAADGLADSHEIGIWNSAGTLLVSATIAAGTSAPLDVNNLFRLVDIPDFYLAPGTDYVVGAVFLQNSDDRQAFTFAGLAINPAIAYKQLRFANNGVPSLSFPTATASFTGAPGGSFELVEVPLTASVPEPSTLASLGLAGLIGVATRLRRRQA